MSTGTVPPSYALSEKQMQKALACHQSGKLAEAESYYRQVLRLYPDQPDANNLLGVLLFQTNRTKDGLQYLNRAVELKPQESMFFYNYGVALRAVGDQANAIRMLSASVQFKPDHVDAISQLAEIYQKTNEWDKAIAMLEKASSLNPMDAKLLRRLGDLLHHVKRYQEATVVLRKAIGITQNDASLHHQLGLCLQATGDHEGAIACYKKCIEIKGDIAPAHNNLAILYADQNKNEQAIEHYLKALEINGGLFQTKCNLGGLYRKTGQLDESVRWLESAVDQKPDCGEAWCNLGNALGDRGEIDRAMDCYRIAILNQPDYAQARLNRAIGLLRAEKFEEGWLEYEWRYKLKECPKRPFSKPRWDGRNLKGKRLLVHAEQGLGDTLQMLRYVHHLRNQGANIVLECQKALVPLLTANKVAQEIIGLGTKIPEFDLHIPLMSLPSLMFEQMGFAADPIPYLKADPVRLEKWKEELLPLKGLKIGVFWQGNPEFKQDAARSIPLKCYLPLLQMPNTSIVSLQKGFGSEQIKEQPDGAVIQFEGMDSEGGAFMDSAAILPHLDLLVTSDSAIAHLAGAMGIRTYLLLPTQADWRWFTETSECPWYPSTTLVRKRPGEEWEDTIQRVVAMVSKL